MTQERGMNEENSMLERLKGQIRKELQNQNRIEEEELNACIQRNIEEEATGHYLPLRKRLELRTRLYDAFRRLDILQELVDDPQVTEIMVNGKDHIFVEKKGAISRWEHGFEREEQLGI